MQSESEMLAPVFVFGARRLGRMGPLGLAFTAYRLWRRLSPQQKQAIRGHATRLVGTMRNRSSGLRRPTPNGPGGIGEAGARDDVVPAAGAGRESDAA
jgi:hypothetical protein